MSEEEDGEIELNLGLSLCGSFTKSKGSETPLLVRNREEEGEIGERASKRERIDPAMLTLSRNVGPYPGYNSPPAPIPVVPKPYSLQDPHAVPYSCVVPCWAGNVRPETGVMQPAVCRSFQPYPGNALPGCNRVIKPDPESGGNQNVVSDGSPTRSSPAFSEQGGSSSDTGSRSNHSKHEHSAHSETRENLGHPEHGVSSTHMDSKSANSKEKVTMPSFHQSNPTRLHEPTKPKIHSEPLKKSEIQEDTQQVPTSGPLRPAVQDLRRPPKPGQVQRSNNQSQKMPSFSQMPCVSTTGNGPNGKTITGFLYRYTKSEVSIICVCHGTSFSPSEFVEHAGGTDVSHPLKHITVIPSAFG